MNEQERKRLISFSLVSRIFDNAIPKGANKEEERKKYSERIHKITPRTVYFNFLKEQVALLLPEFGISPQETTYQNPNPYLYMYAFPRKDSKLKITVRPDFKIAFEEIITAMPLLQLSFYDSNEAITRAVFQKSADEFLFLHHRLSEKSPATIVAESSSIDPVTYAKSSDQGISVLRQYLPRGTIVKSVNSIDGRMNFANHKI